MVRLPILGHRGTVAIHRLVDWFGSRSARGAFRPCEMRQGKLHLEAFEVCVTHHCNLACRACSHASPVMPAHNVDARQVRSDLTRLARHCEVDHIRLLGGEPLIHPNLLELIAEVRAAKIGPRIRLVTNGLLLPRQNPSFWRAIDELIVSVYPGKEPEPAQLDVFRETARKHEVELTISHYDRFGESYSELGTNDAALTARIFATCHLAHVWRCHVVDGGYVYRCPQSLLLPRMMGLGDDEAGRLKIEDDADFAHRLHAFLTSPVHPETCRHCLGSVGRLFPNEQAPRKHWREQQRRKVEELLDRDYLHVLENQMPGAPTLCDRAEAHNRANRELALRRRVLS